MVHARVKLFLLSLSVLTTLAHASSEKKEHADEANNDDDDEEDEMKQLNVFKARELCPWAGSGHIEVYFGEFLLASWVLNKAPWNAYHSGLAFVNNESGQKCLYDFSPADVSSVMNMLIPQVDGPNGASTLLGDFRMAWKDQARTQLDTQWPDNYERFVKLGVINGTLFHIFTDWVASDFAPVRKSFQPLEVTLANGESAPRSADSAGIDWGPVAVRSTMCHDFVTDALWVFHRHGVVFKPETQVFRDHIIMYAKSASNASDLVDSYIGRRKWLRYLRQLYLSLAKIRKEFTHAREALVWTWRLGLPTFLHAGNSDYHLELMPPFLNYCYLPLAMPPVVHNPLGDLKLCALGLVANTTNTTAPWPWGVLLETEERLDHYEIIGALLLAGFIAALVASQDDAVMPKATATSKASAKSKKVN